MMFHSQWCYAVVLIDGEMVHCTNWTDSISQTTKLAVDWVQKALDDELKDCVENKITIEIVEGHRPLDE